MNTNQNTNNNNNNNNVSTSAQATSLIAKMKSDRGLVLALTNIYYYTAPGRGAGNDAGIWWSCWLAAEDFLGSEGTTAVGLYEAVPSVATEEQSQAVRRAAWCDEYHAFREYDRPTDWGWNGRRVGDGCVDECWGDSARFEYWLVLNELARVAMQNDDGGRKVTLVVDDAGRPVGLTIES